MCVFPLVIVFFLRRKHGELFIVCKFFFSASSVFCELSGCWRVVVLLLASGITSVLPSFTGHMFMGIK